MTQFVPDGSTITWRVKDSTNSGDIGNYSTWEEVDTSETVDCGCSGGVLDLALGACGNGSTTPTLTLNVNSSDTTYYMIEYKRSTDSNWVMFRTEEAVSGGLPVELDLDVTVPHQATIQVRYRVTKTQSALSTADLKYTNTLTVDCPFNTVTFTPSSPSCNSNNVQQPQASVVNTTSSTQHAYVRVQYKLTTNASEALASGTWINTSLFGTLLPANGVPYVTNDVINVADGQKIVWRWEWSYDENFAGNWAYDETVPFVNCVKDFTITQSLGACNVGKALATISLSNNESDNKLWFKVEVSTDNQNFAVVSGAGNVEVNANSDQQVTYELLHEQRAYWRVTVTSDDNNYDDANLTTVVTETSNIVNCPLVTGSATAEFGNCTNGSRESVLTMTNPSSSNSNAYFHVYYSLDGGNTWSTRVFVTIQPGGTDTTSALVPDGQRIRWKYYPHTEEIEPTDVVYVELPDSEEVDCAFDTIVEALTMETDCASDGTATSNYQIRNNSSTTLYYSIQYRIQGNASYETVNASYELAAGALSEIFSQAVPSGKFIQWRYKVAADAGQLPVTTAQQPGQSSPANCDIIDPSYDIAQGSCSDGTKYGYFYAKNGSIATSDVYFRVYVSIDGGAFDLVTTRVVPPNSQARVETPTLLSAGDSVRWKYETSKDGQTFTGETTSNIMNILCNSGDDVSFTVPTTCSASGTKTATVQVSNSSSSIKYYKIEYSKVQNPTNDSDWNLLVSNEGIPSSGDGAWTESLSEGDFFTIRYKIADSGTTAAFDAISEWTVSNNVEGPINCSGDIEVRSTLNACDGGARNSVFYFRNKLSTGSPAYFEIEYSINGGAWINPKEGESSNYFTALHTTSTEQSVDVLVPSGSTIQWRYKDTLTVGALSTKSFQYLTQNPESVECTGSVIHEMNIGECTDRKASSTLTLKNDGYVSVYVDIYFSTDGGNSWNNHASGVLIQPNQQPVFTENNISNGSSVKWKYQYSSTSSTVSTALETPTIDRPAIDCDSIVVSSLSYVHNFAECVEGRRIGTFTITNPASTNSTIYVQVQYRTKSQSGDWSDFVGLNIDSIASGTNESYSAPSIAAGSSIHWQFRASLASNDFAGDWINGDDQGYKAECSVSSEVTQAYGQCSAGEQFAILTIKNTGSVSQYYKVTVKINHGSFSEVWSQREIAAGDEYKFEYPISQGESISWEYTESIDTDFSDDTAILRLRQTNQCTPTFSLEYQTVCNDASTTNNTQLTNTKVNLTLKNTSSVDGSVTVQYRYLVTDTWSTLNNYSLNSNQTQTVPYILSNPYVEFQFAPTGTQNWSNTGSILKRTDCDTITTSVNNLTGVNSFICSEDQVFSTITIKNPTSDAVMVDYSYSVNNGNNWSTNKQIIIGSNDDITSEPVRIAKGNQIQWRYKPSSLSDDNYNTKIETAPINCDVVTAQQLIHTLGTCEDNKGISTIKITNLSGTTKSYLLEFKLNGGGYSSYGTVIVESGKDLSKAVRISDGQSIQWRIIDATSNASTIAVDSNWTVSNSLTLDCATVTTTTTTTIPPVKYIFEPIISTNRVCDFDDGGAEFGITVDNSRSNVSASVLKKIWINKTLIAEEIITVPAGQTIDFSSIEVGENKFFTVALEVTNTENGKVQKMIKNKDSDCIEDEIEINEEQNPIDEVEETEDIDNVMEGDGDDKELEDNGESLLFLPGDDYVEFVYNEDASNPFTPQFTDESPATPGIPFTGRNVGGFIISFGLLLMGLELLYLEERISLYGIFFYLFTDNNHQYICGIVCIKIRRNRLNDPDVITDATLVEEDSIQQVKNKKSFSLLINKIQAQIFLLNMKR